MSTLTAEQIINALVATSPLRHLMGDNATLWISWDEKVANIARIKVGDVEWSRDCIEPKLNMTFGAVVMNYFCKKPSKGQLKDYSVLDIIGQKWIGRGYRGQAMKFAKCKEI